MNTYFADFHIHIGRTKTGKPVKISGAKSLTLSNLIHDASEVKGLNMIGVIDAHVPEVMEEMRELVAEGKVEAQADGGLRFKNVTVMLGSEIEIYDESCSGPFHVLVYFPDLDTMKQFSDWLSGHMKNITLSSQRYYGTGRRLQEKTEQLGGLFVVAHAFTPHKGLYGSGVVKSLVEVLDPDRIDAIELGLSADSGMADHLSELHRYPYLSNSDAHSLAKMAREYETLNLKAPTFAEWRMALRKEEGREITANYGLNPRLGKYHRTMCNHCFEIIEDDNGSECPFCGFRRITKGVADRLAEIADHTGVTNERPPYIYQIPLEFIPKLGPKTLERLRQRFKTDMAILHEASEVELQEIVSGEMADAIIKARHGKLAVRSGGAGRYGKVDRS
ncbi:MAG TPA: endonuclease Q family protein [Bacillales bacterium]|nr:endonuclease Q family protein [Bacillales bacterium]